MLPSSTNLNITNRCLINSILRSNMLLLSNVFSDIDNIILGKLGFWIFFTNRVGSILNSVVNIILIRPPAKMLRVYAGNISARVKCKSFVFWRISSGYLKHISMCSKDLLIKIHRSIPIACFTKRPEYTMIQIGFSNLISELYSSSFGGINFFHIKSNNTFKSGVQE